ncbi:hypothetical protein CONPUDRAFT_162554 [Coniophora puteana RWD-64-598 SS2]|uniref:Phosphoglucomutase 1 n=1 Tax=Coniophora puteana (strain RWD-64-598) TaxID=741705 RepID=A0A5M3N3B7_CONPW|nr:uncharacterized protein CONPUDRAFT_162554 [Coniophora puteana RWD-64-598 SS2]EIW85345.1 hypothetical protein CONPUDRAFT_162554 [Coniophora puteana RWD-64-598 SS2]
MSDLESLVNEWLRLDRNGQTRAEIEILWQYGNTQELESRLRNRIEFGTAGLRGRMEAGWARMNDLIIIQASQGLCAYVIREVENAKERGVVMGHDHRHNSARWAQLAAAAFISQGVKVYLHRGLVHTPLVPFSVKALRAACGVMITASHNPKDDNGYKVYWENAVQIIEPHDKGIATSIKENLEPRTWDVSLTSDPLCLDRTEEMKKMYFESLQKLASSISTNSACATKFVNTSMHGVGYPFVAQAFKIFEFPAPISVHQQQDPDPDFPTVAFPNPEEKGALDLAISTANEQGASYVLAQDPDADRFSAAEKRADGTWKVFTGDQLGTLFACKVLATYKASGKPLDKLAMVASTVSSKMIETMANDEGFRFVECLTGFKFIGNTALDLVAQGYDVPFGYEEAIGFMFGEDIRDKDGVAATMMFAELVASLSSRNLTLQDYLEEQYDRYGYFETNNSYFICSDPAVIDKVFTSIRTYNEQQPSEKTGTYPTEIAGLQVTRVVDLTSGYGFDSGNAPSFQPSLPLSSGHMIQIRASAGSGSGLDIVLTIRTSGTEPKIKYYLEGKGEYRQVVHKLLPEVISALKYDWMKASENHLE